MKDDKQRIRDLVERWHQSTAAGDLVQILGLMSDDAIFLRAGHPPMTRNEFAVEFQDAVQRCRMEPSGEIEEIEVYGDMAHIRNRLSIKITPNKEGASQHYHGYALSIFRKRVDGQWVLVRDANMLAPAQPD